MTARAAVEPISERVFDAQVVRLARSLGYTLIYHTWRSIRSAPGFPDRVFLRPPKPGRSGRLIFVELKSEDGELSTAQAEWLTGLKSVGQEAYCFRPSDWDEIVRVLA